MTTQKPIRIHKSIDPTWQKWSASVPGIQSTQWFNSEAEAAAFIVSKGFEVFNESEHGLTRISNREHAALCAVAEAASKVAAQGYAEMVSSAEFSNRKAAMRQALSQLATIRKG